MGNSNESLTAEQKAVMEAAKNAAKDKEVQDTMKHAANKPGLDLFDCLCYISLCVWCIIDQRCRTPQNPQ